MITNEFYLTLPSNVKGDSNTTSSFTTILPKTIDLPGTWVCGLAEIMVPFSWLNLGINSEDLDIYIRLGYDMAVGGVRLVVRLTPNYYDSIYSLIHQVNWQINSLLSDELAKILSLPQLYTQQLINQIMERKNKPLIKIDFDEMLKRATIEINDRLISKISLPRRLQYLLGFVSSENIDLHLVAPFATAKYPPDLTGGFSSAYVYCDCIEPVVVGDTLAPLLRTVSLATKKQHGYGENIVKQFINPHFKPVIATNLHSIKISINDDRDQPIKFQFGKSCVTLLFKRLK